MNIYIDESGSINNAHTDSFVIAFVCVTNANTVRRVYKKFVAKNLKKLQELDKDRKDKHGKILKEGGKMFLNGKFRELKGSLFTPELKRQFIAAFSKAGGFELFYVKLNNSKLSDNFCKNTARGFNFVVKNALIYFYTQGFLSADTDYLLQIDERNEKPDAKNFLENYLNTELPLMGVANSHFEVKYFDSADNTCVQIADVFSNFYFSSLYSDTYAPEMESLKNAGILKAVFEFPETKTRTKKEKILTK